MRFWMFLVPLFVVGFATILRTARGPFWIGMNIDPEYVYLINSLSLTQGLTVGHAHHPGSTLQWAGAIWLYGINFLLGKDDLITDVLTRPEFYHASLFAELQRYSTCGRNNPRCALQAADELIGGEHYPITSSTTRGSSVPVRRSFNPLRR